MFVCKITVDLRLHLRIENDFTKQFFTIHVMSRGMVWNVFTGYLSWLCCPSRSKESFIYWARKTKRNNIIQNTITQSKTKQHEQANKLVKQKTNQLINKESGFEWFADSCVKKNLSQEVILECHDRLSACGCSATRRLELFVAYPTMCALKWGHGNKIGILQGW